MSKTLQSDVYGLALSDYYNGRYEPPLLLNNTYGDPEEMPVEVFFREESDLSDLELYALHMCNGKVLDVGAGVGVHSLILQQRHIDVTAIETSGAACDIMKERGVKRVHRQNIFELETSEKFDTLLLLMNGTGISGTFGNFKNSLNMLRKLLKVGGQIIIDSSDIAYLYEGSPSSDKYFGEVSYQYEYKGHQGQWFPWLYLDQQNMIMLATRAGFEAHIVYQGSEDQYLTVLKAF